MGPRAPEGEPEGLSIQGILSVGGDGKTSGCSSGKDDAGSTSLTHIADVSLEGGRKTGEGLEDGRRGGRKNPSEGENAVIRRGRSPCSPILFRHFGERRNLLGGVIRVANLQEGEKDEGGPYAQHHQEARHGLFGLPSPLARGKRKISAIRVKGEREYGPPLPQKEC